jgi:hypothetical protein
VAAKQLGSNIQHGAQLVAKIGDKTVRAWPTAAAEGGVAVVAGPHGRRGGPLGVAAAA